MSVLDHRQNFEIAENVFYQPTSDEMVLLDLQTQKYYGLDATGARIWHLLLEHHNITDVAAHLVAEYDVDLDRALSDVEVMVNDFYSAGLIQIRG